MCDVMSVTDIKEAGTGHQDDLPRGQCESVAAQGRGAGWGSSVLLQRRMPVRQSSGRSLACSLGSRGGLEPQGAGVRPEGDRQPVGAGRGDGGGRMQWGRWGGGWQGR